MSKKWGMIGVVLLVAGCTHPPPRSLPPLLALDPGSCQPSIVLQAATPVALGEPETEKNEVMFGDYGPCVLQSDGSPANYHVFRLPPADLPYLVTVRTEPVGPAYLVVQAQTLAADGSVIRTLDPDKFTFHGTSLMVLVRSQPGQEYLVVRSDGSRVGRAFDQIAETSLLYTTTTTTTVKGHTFFSSTSSPVGGSSQGTYVFSHNGSLHVTAKPIVGG